MGVVVYPPTIDWTYMKQRPQHLMEQFAAKGHTVLYFNKQNGNGPAIDKIGPNLYVVGHAAFALDELLPRLRLPQPLLYWTSWSRKIPFARRLWPGCTVIYDCVDDFPDWEADERRWLDEADGIVCTAEPLERKMRAAAPDKPVLRVPNGCDWNFFNKAAFPSAGVAPTKELPPRDGPRFGYIGAWAPWVDEQLLVRLAREMPEAQVVLVGPKLRSDEPEFPDNLLYLGYRDYAKLPELLRAIDVCLIPFRLNRITASTNPIKAYEYLAAGKPVVSTDLPEVRRLRPFVAVADTPERFIQAARKAAANSGRDAAGRAQFARAFSWERRFSRIEQALAELAPAFLNVGGISEQLEALGRFQASSYPLLHATVNSYYKDGCFPDSPAWTGALENGEYECYLKLAGPEPITPAPAKRLYLEFETDPAVSQGEDTFEIGWSDTDWSPAAMTYANRPQSLPLGSIGGDRAFGETYSLDVTEAWKSGIRSFRVRFSGKQVTPLYNPRLTAVSSAQSEGGGRA